MQHSKIFTFFSILVILVFNGYKVLCCSYPPKTIAVSHSGKGSFRTIQRAINYIPTHNTQWIHIRISAAIYREKVEIPADKPCIFLEGLGSSSTIIEWNDHQQMSTSATFSSLATDSVAKGIKFKNTYNRPPSKDEINKGNLPALAAKIEGDRSAFFDCAFEGVQDTMFDNSGRHYFHNCYIQGGIDFIFGNDQSIYEKSVIKFTMGADGPKGVSGHMTAQGRESMNETSGFVFKDCNITGTGKTYLGRAFSRVIIATSVLSDVIEPKGWFAWDQVGHEANLTYVKEGCTGPGANKSKRVPWFKHMDAKELNQFLSVSYIDQEEWISNLPTNSD